MPKHPIKVTVVEERRRRYLLAQTLWHNVNEVTKLLSQIEATLYEEYQAAGRELEAASSSTEKAEPQKPAR